jgi:hypothetical protein
MSYLDRAIEKHMTHIVLTEKRPFSHRDFMLFEVDGKEYRMTHGTFRNKILTLRKKGKVELAYNAGTAFYTIKGIVFGKKMTPDHAGVYHSKMDSFSRLICDLPTETPAVHDIRLKFQVQGIWSKLPSIHPEIPVNQRSKDICIPTWKIGALLVRTTVHKSDTVSVIVACSLAPVTVNFDGLTELSNALVRVQERLNVILNEVNYCSSDQSRPNDCDHKNSDGTKLKIPDHEHWVVSMWHFGADGLVEYTGDKFTLTWEIGQNALMRAYAKKMKDKRTRIRLERQEYPNKSLQQIVGEKLNPSGTN